MKAGNCQDGGQLQREDVLGRGVTYCRLSQSFKAHISMVSHDFRSAWNLTNFINNLNENYDYLDKQS